MPRAQPTYSADAPGKINLGLHVLATRADGYHEIETVFLRIGWCDTVTIESGTGEADGHPGELSLRCDHPGLPTDRSNLCLKAAHILRDTVARHELGASIYLKKRLPVTAGLGGGSSDAATTLRLLRDCWELDLDDDGLSALGTGLGADVPFFLGAPVALGTGTGSDLTPLDHRLPFALVVVKPALGISTAEAYRGVVPTMRPTGELTEIVISNDLERWRRELQNDFENPIVSKHPELGDIRRGLMELGAGYVSMSGSGSAFYGVFEQANRARRAARAFAETGVESVWWGSAASPERGQGSPPVPADAGQDSSSPPPILKPPSGSGR